MVINITETHHGNHAGQSGRPTEAAGNDDRLATLADYLLEKPFRERLDFIVSAQSDQMSFHHTDFEDFVADHLLNSDWEERRYTLLELADQMEGNGRELRQIVLATPVCHIVEAGKGACCRNRRRRNRQGR